MWSRSGVRVGGALLLALAACASDPSPTAPAATEAVATTQVVEPAASDAPVPPVAGVPPEGFDAVRATATAADGTVCELCLWLASTGEQRQLGLMHVTDLGAADGMAFVYEEPHSGAFWMKNTLLPLSIAFYDVAGGHLDAFDMAPCTADPCPTYPTPDDFVVAVEVAQGTLAGLGLTPGSTLALTDLPCASRSGSDPTVTLSSR